MASQISDFWSIEARYRGQIALAAQDYAPSASRRAQTVTMWGAFIGVGFVACLLFVIGVIAATIDYSPLDVDSVAATLGCAAAGALGACTSVSWRVLTFGELRVDAGASVLTLRGLGAVRPIVGSIFGVAAYFALKSGFITLGTTNFYFFAFFAFVAGFSERFVPDLVGKAEKAPT
jgi:hypothetical protein